MTANSRWPLYLGLTVWFALLGFRGYDYTAFRKTQEAREKARAAQEAELQAKFDERSRVEAQNLDANWEGHQKMEINLESIEAPRSHTNFTSRKASGGSGASCGR